MSEIEARIGFQLLILDLFPEPARAKFCAETLMSASERSIYRGTTIEKLGGNIFNMTLDILREVLGPAGESVNHVSAQESKTFAGGRRSSFVLDLWPHLYFDVYEKDGVSHVVGFREQQPLPIDPSPALIRPGVWTLSMIRRIWTHGALLDGWDDFRLYRVHFGDVAYLAHFVLGVLVDWKPGSESPST